MGKGVGAKISEIADVFIESKKHLMSLSESFTPAVAMLSEKNRSFEIIDGLTMGDIYTREDFESKNLVTISSLEFENFVDKLNSILDTSGSIHELIDRTFGECVVWDSPEFEYDDEANIIGERDNPTYKLFVKFGELYMDGIDLLVDDIVRNDFEQNWNLLFELKSPTEIEKFLEKSETLLPDQRKICSYYYDMMIRVRDHFFDINESELLPEDFPDEDRNLWSSWKTISPGPTIIWQQPATKEGDTQLQRILRILQMKVTTFYSKVTLLEFRDPFVNKIKLITESSSLPELNPFIENSFHFSDSVWTKKLRDHSLPKMMASKIAVLLRTYFDQNKIIGATKKDLILWLACEFYGVKGFKYDNLKGYLERGFLSDNHKATGTTIVKSFQKKLNQKKPK